MAIWQGKYTGDEWHSLFFKRVSEGWIFRSPVYWWPFSLGPVRHYLVSETQKAEIIGVMGGSWDWRGRVILVTAALLGIIPLLMLLWNVPVLWNISELPLLIFFLLFGLWVQAVFNIFYSLMLRSRLAGLPRTSERITMIESLSAYSAMTPVGTWIFGGLLFASGSGLLLYQALVLKNFDHWLSMIIMGLGATYSFTMVKFALKAKQSTG